MSQLFAAWLWIQQAYLPMYHALICQHDAFASRNVGTDSWHLDVPPSAFSFSFVVEKSFWPSTSEISGMNRARRSCRRDAVLSQTAPKQTRRQWTPPGSVHYRLSMKCFLWSLLFPIDNDNVIILFLPWWSSDNEKRDAGFSNVSLINGRKLSIFWNPQKWLILLWSRNGDSGYIMTGRNRTHSICIDFTPSNNYGSEMHCVPNQVSMGCHRQLLCNCHKCNKKLVTELTGEWPIEYDKTSGASDNTARPPAGMIQGRKPERAQEAVGIFVDATIVVRDLESTG